MFSSVLLAQDELSNRQVAIKVLRGIDIMGQAGRKELDILKALTAKDTKVGQAGRQSEQLRLPPGCARKDHEQQACLTPSPVCLPASL